MQSSDAAPRNIPNRDGAVDVVGRLTSALVPLAMAAIWVAALIYFWDARFNHDSSWYLSATHRWLFDGATLYIEIFELNPPLFFYLTAPAVLAANALGIADATAFNLYIFLLAGLSLALTFRIVATSGANALLAGAYALAATVVVLFAATPEYGQREHFAVIFALPYITMAAFVPISTVHTRSTRIGTAAFACLGLFIKPHFLLVPLAISLTQCRRARSWSPLFSTENWTIGLLAVAYLAFAAIGHPSYFADIVPLARKTYGAWGRPAEMLRPYQAAFAALAIAFLILLRSRPSIPFQRTAEILMAATLAFFAAFLIQNKGFGYHLIPASAFIALAAIVVLAGLLHDRFPVALQKLACACVIALTAAYFVVPGKYRNPFSETLRTELGDDLAGRNVIGLSIFMEPFFPYVTDVGARWVLGYPGLWPLLASYPALKSSDPAKREEASRIIADVARNVASDIRRGKPDYVIVDRAFGPAELDYVALFLKTSEFATEWKSYRKVRDLTNVDLWERYRPAS